MGLIPTLLSSFMVDVAQRVIVENFDIDKFLTGILDSAPAVARHTPVVHIKKTDSGVVTSAWRSLGYQEAHSGLRSRGQVRK